MRNEPLCASTNHERPAGARAGRPAAQSLPGHTRTGTMRTPTRQRGATRTSAVSVTLDVPSDTLTVTV